MDDRGTNPTDIHESPNGSSANGAAHDDVTGKIFVGGLSWQTTEESMRYHFEKFGELTDIAIMTDKRTGQPR
jgi:RNA recognition motif-containing protein